jgi:hypothetical protein
MPTKTTSITASRGAAMFATMALPLEPFSVRIPVAVQLTGIGRSKLYELIAAGEVEIVKVGASTLVTVASLRQLIQCRRRKTMSASGDCVEGKGKELGH